MYILSFLLINLLFILLNLWVASKKSDEMYYDYLRETYEKPRSTTRNLRETYEKPTRNLRESYEYHEKPTRNLRVPRETCE